MAPPLQENLDYFQSCRTVKTILDLTRTAPHYPLTPHLGSIGLPSSVKSLLPRASSFSSLILAPSGAPRSVSTITRSPGAGLSVRQSPS